MRYRKFIIKGYRGISDATEINLTRDSLIPIIGKNESGKTTCLEAINAFDYYNDSDNDGKHLSNVENLYSTTETPIIVAAEIEVGADDVNFESFFAENISTIEKEFKAKYPQAEFNLADVDDSEQFTHMPSLRARNALVWATIDGKFQIERDLRTKKYALSPLQGIPLDESIHQAIAEEYLKNLPYILYFDDFRDRMPEKLFITADNKLETYSGWIRYIDELFQQTKAEYNVYKLPETPDSRRRSIISEVQKKLNKVLAEEWGKYQFERKESIEIRLDYLDATTTAPPSLRFKIVEHVLIDEKFEERYFDISDRSKGFYWYFNFMVKLFFNPKKRENDDVDTIYLLDEPGSYLHTYALNKLAEQLKVLSEKNKVIYCTHFHNLLNPDFVPINSIRVAEKVSQGKILLKRLEDAPLIRHDKNSPYQPILDALEVKPPIFEYDYNNVVLLEGIYDYYSFRMFCSDFFAYFPCVAASSIIKQIPYMIFLGKKYLAVWDDDNEGRARLREATEYFGEVESQRFLTLPPVNGSPNTRLEEYYDASELDKFRKDHLNDPALSFYKLILKLFYAPEREVLINSHFPSTKKNFREVENMMKEKLGAHLNV